MWNKECWFYTSTQWINMWQKFYECQRVKSLTLDFDNDHKVTFSTNKTFYKVSWVFSKVFNKRVGKSIVKNIYYPILFTFRTTSRLKFLFCMLPWRNKDLTILQSGLRDIKWAGILWLQPLTLNYDIGFKEMLMKCNSAYCLIPNCNEILPAVQQMQM